MIILGINAYHGDVSVALIRDGELIATAEEERFRRVKHWAGFPREALKKCLEMAGVGPESIDHFAVSRNPRANLFKKMLFALWKRPSLSLIRGRLENRGRVMDLAGDIAACLGLEKKKVHEKLHWVEHHPSHLASSFFVSPFEEAAICAIDGFGDFVGTSMAIGRGNRIEILDRVFFPHSYGLLYLAITQFLGFQRYGDEFKVMGLAPYGNPDSADLIRRLVHLLPGGRFELDLSYFRHWSEGVSMTWDEGEPTLGPVWAPKLEELLGPARHSEEPLEMRHENLAASLQLVFEEIVFHVLTALYEKTKLSRLCLAGGCVMNSVMNGKIRGRTPFEEVYIQPASGDNGTALGAAFYIWHQTLGNSRSFVMDHAMWGLEYTQEEIKAELSDFEDQLRDRGCTIQTISDERELCRWTSEKIAEGKVVGWFQGREEWGARALGNRSILADPRRTDMREIINMKIKFREKFRPFAPSIREEAMNEYFVDAVPDPFMIQVYPVRPEKREVIPAVTHVDGSGRLQTVSQKSNPLYWKLLGAFEEITGVPVLLNTSFNENEPIVHRPAEALHCFIRTDMDVLVIGRYIIEKERG